MKSVFNPSTRSELIDRINKLNENSKAIWGKMTLFQMLQHGTLWDEWVQGKTKYKRVFIGRILGKVMLKKALQDDAPLQRNTPTIPPLIPKEKEGNISAQKAAWISSIEGYANFSNPGFVHVFFGKMTDEQIGHFAYKHIDHHLRQFNA